MQCKDSGVLNGTPDKTSGIRQRIEIISR